MSKLYNFENSKQWKRISNTEKDFISKIEKKYLLTFQDLKNLIDIAADLESWDEKGISLIWPEDNNSLKNRELKIYKIGIVQEYWKNLKHRLTNYDNFNPKSDFKQRTTFIDKDPNRTLLGECPVASEKTRCCNLKTLDAIVNCGFDCSYCTIQSFYKDGRVLFEKDLESKLKKLNLDPNKKYHIGTGQSSDSLMWGNRANTLTHLFNFAQENPNVVLELKTKSANIDYLLENRVPRNVIVTWSLNSETIIKNEEHLTASLNERLKAAKQVSEKGILVGFHFHPMVYYKGWKEDYSNIATMIVNDFTPEKVALISIGTLTFIKPVIKKIRNRDFKTKILQMPLLDAEGKFSYPYETKKEMFKHLYNSFSPWHNMVYFYMCMEDKALWKDVFGFQYSSNKDFEEDMLENYFTKINN